jgi:N-acetylglucosaminyldiphosphoundecaprenol N-acetyl-beta-D-mannosaminyltransferase
MSHTIQEATKPRRPADKPVSRSEGESAQRRCRTDARVAGVPVSCASPEDVLSEMARVIESRGPSEYISITNTESMYHARRIPHHLRYIEGARFSLCDGMGVVIAGRFGGARIPRLNGPVLLLKACEYGVPRRWRHCFYGGREGVADALSERLSAQFPGLVAAGTFCPPFRPLTPEEDDAIVRRINASRPDIVWVGLGLLKQEQWIADHIHRIDAPWLIGVGAAFDYHTGQARWAPRWIRAIGLEWLYRLCHEPRMFVRNVRSFAFMIEAIVHRSSDGRSLGRRHRPEGSSDGAKASGG